MAGYRRIISVVDPAYGGASAAVERAAALASVFKGKLAVLGAAAQLTGADSSVHEKASMIATASGHVEQLVTQAGARSAEVMAGPRELHALLALALSWQPDLIVMAADALPELRVALEAMRGSSGTAAFDLLSVDTARPGPAKGLIAAIGSLF
jgi:nucleotide-binding universal stress UspA family protein